MRNYCFNTYKKSFGILCFIVIVVSFLFVNFVPMAQAEKPSKIVSYDLSKAPKILQDLKIPDFLAYATNNKEKTPINTMFDGYVPSDSSCGFDLGDVYFQNYHNKVGEYIRFLETQGFKYNAGWEGFIHLEKMWKNHYVLVSVGSYAYETNGISVSIHLSNEQVKFPSHHTDTWYRNEN